MDFITHALVGAGAARLISPKRNWVPQLSLAAILASELPDADPWLYLIDPAYYGKYHRVTTHNLWALCLIALVCASVAWAITYVKPWRRFGWFVSDRIPRAEDPIAHAPWGWFVLAALPAAYLHFLFDTITGFGNILPLWPWSTYDASLHAVSSFDVVIFASTLVWHFALRMIRFTRRGEILLTIAYVALVAMYVTGRWLWGSSTVW